MKRGNLALFLLGFVLAFGYVSATCTLEPSLINQDPYPVVPGDYATLVFQVKGVENSECGSVYIELVDKYPISFDPNASRSTEVKAGTFVKDYSSYLRVPYKVRIDPDAIDGNSTIELKYASSKIGVYDIFLTKSFNLSVKDVRSDFEVFVKDYNPSTGKITFEILNTGKSDVDALTVKVTPRDNLVIRGPLTNIVGSLDSNDFTTVDFDMLANKGEIELMMSYTDSINNRRTVEKTVDFDPEPFNNKIAAQNKKSPTFYVVILLIVGGVAYFFYRRHKKKKEKHKLHHR
ncbi:hypothetical protein COU59_01990 [Candidatus Pacearchaeota archaeon CG10_big_fil_rev_8_21_14_0_10_34_12]|nr:MAG: hypothetical protein COU59_01990 [Candidatus Pacearchaeota archaeon CG10_big_fil_rev_8_21_14_0_10_34_12]